MPFGPARQWGGFSRKVPWQSLGPKPAPLSQAPTPPPASHGGSSPSDSRQPLPGGTKGHPEQQHRATGGGEVLESLVVHHRQPALDIALLQLVDPGDHLAHGYAMGFIKKVAIGLLRKRRQALPVKASKNSLPVGALLVADNLSFLVQEWDRLPGLRPDTHRIDANCCFVQRLG